MRWRVDSVYSQRWQVNRLLVFRIVWSLKHFNSHGLREQVNTNIQSVNVEYNNIGEAGVKALMAHHGKTKYVKFKRHINIKDQGLYDYVFNPAVSPESLQATEDKERLEEVMAKYESSKKPQPAAGGSTAPGATETESAAQNGFEPMLPYLLVLAFVYIVIKLQSSSKNEQQIAELTKALNELQKERNSKKRN